MTEKVLFLLEEIVDGATLAFSRRSLSQKLYYDRDSKKGDFTRTINRYEKLKYIKRAKQGKYIITKKGKKKINEFKIKKVSFNKENWDGFWRIVIFDIPEKKKFARDAIRRRLRLYNFYPLQKSVFVCPYDCEAALETIGEFFNIHNYIDLIKTKTLGKKEKVILDYFEL